MEPAPRSAPDLRPATRHGGQVSKPPCTVNAVATNGTTVMGTLLGPASARLKGAVASLKPGPHAC